MLKNEITENKALSIARVSGSTFVKADCFDVFPFIKDKSIDAIICDLPYGTTACKWDSILSLADLWAEYERIIKDNGAIILFGSQPFTSTLINSNTKLFKYELIWDKVSTSSGVMAKKQPMKCHENILIFYKKQPTYNPQMYKGKQWSRGGKNRNTPQIYGDIKSIGKPKNDTTDMKYPKSIITFSNANRNNRIHPTEKQIDLMEWIVKTYTNEGDMVLDNTMGSGTTNLACIKLNRKSIGIEKEKQYYDVAVRRASEYCH
jgi:site-specific DNA-methyltransferase (adenine-specific)